MPDGKPPNTNLFGIKCKFTKEEDTILKQLVESNHGSLSWKEISQKLGTRTPRQCRERYKNYLSNQVNRGEWTLQEDEIIMNKFLELGKVWNAIAKFLPGRTGNAVRNRWKYLISKRSQEPSVPNLKQTPPPIATIALSKDGIEQAFTQANPMNKSRSSSDDDGIGQVFKNMFKIQKNSPLYESEEVNEMLLM